MSGSSAAVTFTPQFGLTTISARLVDRAGNQGPIKRVTLKLMSPKAQHAWLLDDGSGSTAADLPRPSNDTVSLQFGAGVSWASGNLADYSGDATDRSLQFNGSGAGAYTSDALVRVSDSFTVMAKVRLDELDPGSKSFIAVSQDGNVNSAFQLGYDTNSDAWAAWMANTDASGPTWTRVAADSGPIDEADNDGLPIPDGEPDWQHLAMVYDAVDEEVELYVDGNLAASANYTFDWRSEGSLRVGRGKAHGNTQGLATGRVDDVVVFDAPLTEAQIRVLRGADKPDHIEAARQAMLDEDKAGHWAMDDGSGAQTTDSSNGGHQVTLGSGTSWISGRQASADPADRALRFDGTSSAYGYTSGPVLDTTSSYTVTAWVKLATGHTQTAGVVSQRGVDSSAMFLVYSGGQDRWRFGAFASDVSGADSLGVNSRAPAARNTWTHLAGVYDADADEMSLYVNGVLQDTVAAPNTWSATGALQVGRYRSSGVYRDRWAGDIDDLRAYQAPLSQSEIRQVMIEERP
ncbi:LamG domain-containing protein [Phytoactinopolyspora alkaliphila]|nr:LamG domain-containing protein [Phytoactinopolyspora alkaliphila]